MFTNKLRTFFTKTLFTNVSKGFCKYLREKPHVNVGTIGKLIK